MTTDFSNVRNVWAQKHANRGIIEILRSKLHNDANSWKPADGVDSSLPFPGTFLGSPLSDAELPKLTLHKSPQPNLQAAEADDDNNIIEQGTDGSSSVIEKPKVAIIGAGAAGLFTAMILDHLNNNEQLKEKGFNVSYEIFESAGKNRLGGRLYTYNFESDGSANPAGPHDYYDVGAMRFPENQVMKRVFDLFAFLKMEKKELKGNTENGSLIPYYMSNTNLDKTVLEPWCYNHMTKWGAYKQLAKGAPGADVFNLNVDPDVQKIPTSILATSPGDTFNRTIKVLRDKLREDLTLDTPGSEGFELLMKYDKYSTRQFLALSQEGKPEDDTLPPFNYETIAFLETFNGGTNWYDQAHSETVLESLDFEYSDDPKDNIWWAILGGANELAKRMAATINTQPTFNSRVTAIRVGKVDDMEIDVRIPNSTGTTTRTFNGVFNSTTLSCLQRVDTSKASLNYTTRQAIRSLGYGPSAKVGIKFNRAWWIHDLPDKYKIKKGGLGHSDLSIRTCVYPSYNIEDSEKLPAVLLCSYTWQQDAERMGALMSSSNKHEQQLEDEVELKDLVLRDLAKMHSSDEMSEEEVYKMISESYLDHFAHDWTHDPNTSGAFAFFRPQQFSNVWNHLIHPGGNLLLIGEASSPHHAWVVGALESAVHGVTLWLKLRQDQILGASDAVEVLEKGIEGNPFVGMPPYVETNVANWAAVNAKYESASVEGHIRGTKGNDVAFNEFLEKFIRDGKS